MCQNSRVTTLHSLSTQYAPLYHDANAGLITDPITRFLFLDFWKTLNIKRDYLNTMYTNYLIYGDALMNETDESKQKRKSGAAEILYDDEYVEITRTTGDEKYIPYTVPKSEVLSIRFSKDDVGKVVRVFKERES